MHRAYVLVCNACVRCVHVRERVCARAYTRAHVWCNPDQSLVVVMSKPLDIIEVPPHMILAPLREHLRRLREAGVLSHPPVSPPPTLVLDGASETVKVKQ